MHMYVPSLASLGVTAYKATPRYDRDGNASRGRILVTVTWGVGFPRALHFSSKLSVLQRRSPVSDGQKLSILGGTERHQYVHYSPSPPKRR